MHLGRTIVSLFASLLYGSTILDPAFPSKECHFPAIYNFGASNSDTGGYAAAFVQPKPPNGETFFGKPAGRLCDGRLIVDFTAKSLELPYLSSYLNSLGTNFSHGANFATSSSTIGIPVADIIPRGGVYASLMPREEDFTKALYTFDIGQNDLIQYLALNMTVSEIKAGIPDIINQFLTNIKELYLLGARSFWIYNTRPIGCFPSILTFSPAAENDSTGCAKIYNEVVQHFNAELKMALAPLRIQFPLATIVYVDLYSAVYSLYTDPTIHGFEHPLVTCCGHGGKYNYSVDAGCGDTINVNSTYITVGSCEDPSVRVSWDGVHFTEAANRFAFDRVSTGDYSDPPIPLKLTCTRGKHQLGFV